MLTDWAGAEVWKWGLQACRVSCSEEDGGRVAVPGTVASWKDPWQCWPAGHWELPGYTKLAYRLPYQCRNICKEYEITSNYKTPYLLKRKGRKMYNIGTFVLHEHAISSTQYDRRWIRISSGCLQKHDCYSHPRSPSQLALSLASVLAQSNIVVQFQELSVFSRKLIGFLIS